MTNHGQSHTRENVKSSSLRSANMWLVALSTLAVPQFPDLPPNRIVDIQVGVAGLDESRPAFEVLEAIGYYYDSVCSHVMHFFDKREQDKQSCNLQLIPHNSECWKMRLAFRDFLRTHPDAVDEYAALKFELAQRFRLDRKAYTEAKGSFILDTVRQSMSPPKWVS